MFKNKNNKGAMMIMNERTEVTSAQYQKNFTSNAKTDGLFMKLEDLDNRWFVMDHILNHLHEDQKVKIRKYIKQLIKEEKDGK
tara:strand:- start:206 stop:454 length:249 start_codon:yes stop_codon:yes gene_type:complete